MAIATYTKSGAKAAAPAKLDKSIFYVEVKNHQLLKDAYLAYLANGRENFAVTKKRGEVRGGGIKPWRQKGTGRARFGSSRNPIWTGGGVAFGPTGNENYTRKLSTASKRTALRQALSLAVEADKLKIIETFACPDGKVKPALELFNKIGANGSVLLVVSDKDDLVERATRNLGNVKAVHAKYLSIYDILNADQIVMSKKALDIIHEWLDPSTIANRPTVTGTSDV
ncbi:50S ribosomal protein L4 [Candidatus Saccharibacteria bacterium]|nr:50S ribosomal protein L4 [Candidatus Saccharibacteria bacterium]